MVAGIPALQLTGRQKFRPAYISILRGGTGQYKTGTGIPQRQETLPYLYDWEHGADEWENKKIGIVRKNAAKTKT